MNAYKRAVELIIGSRLKRLSDKFLSDVALVYRSEGIPFETAYFPVFFLLSHHKTLKVSDVARELEITQSGASQMINALEKKGLVRYDRDRGDKRIRTITFTKQGEELLSRVKPVWETIRSSFRELLEEGENSRYFIPALDEVETTIAHKNLFVRISDTLKKKKLLESTSFEPYSDSVGDEFRDLCLSWILENSFAGDDAEGMINHTMETARQGKAMALTARTDKEVTGAYFVSIAGDLADIQMFSVKKAWQDMDLEKEMLAKLLAAAADNGLSWVSITLERRLTRQIKLFKDAGFALKSMVKGKTGETGFLLSREI